MKMLFRLLYRLLNEKDWKAGIQNKILYATFVFHIIDANKVTYLFL